MVPPVALVLGGLVVAALARQAGSAASELVEEVARLRQIEPALVKIRTEVGRTRATVKALGRR